MDEESYKGWLQERKGNSRNKMVVSMTIGMHDDLPSLYPTTSNEAP